MKKPKKVYRFGVQKKNIGGKSYVVLYEKNRIVEKKRFTSGKSKFNSKGQLTAINLQQARINAKDNNSIFPDRQRQRGQNWNFARYSKSVDVNYTSGQPDLPVLSPVRKPNKRFNYVIQGHFVKNKRIINVAASSDRYDAGEDINTAREQALDYFYKRVSYVAHGEKPGNYDADEGKKIISGGYAVIDKESVVWFTKK